MKHIVKQNLNELLADCGAIDAVSWSAPQAMTYEQWADVGRKFQHVSGAVNWWLGDWLNEGEKRYGEAYAQAIEVTGHKYDQLTMCAWVARQVRFSTRVENLTWTHHRYVAHLDEPAQKTLLTYAAQKELSSRDLLEAVRDYERNLQVQAAPTIDEPLLVAAPIPIEEEEDYLSPMPVITEAPASKPIPHVAHNSGENEWYTPREYIDAARAVLGCIDVDPASSLKANETVQARAFFTAQTNGLLHDWHGRVWLNPPYATPLIGQFITHLVRQVKRGNVIEAIVLVNNATETQWFRDLIGVAAAVCFPTGRVRFWGPNGATGAPLQGQAFVYIGERADVFLSKFSEYGWGAQL